MGITKIRGEKRTKTLFLLLLLLYFSFFVEICAGRHAYHMVTISLNLSLNMLIRNVFLKKLHVSRVYITVFNRTVLPLRIIEKKKLEN